MQVLACSHKPFFKKTKKDYISALFSPYLICLIIAILSMQWLKRKMFCWVPTFNVIKMSHLTPHVDQHVVPQCFFLKQFDERTNET